MKQRLKRELTGNQRKKAQSLKHKIKIRQSKREDAADYYTDEIETSYLSIIDMLTLIIKNVKLLTY